MVALMQEFLFKYNPVKVQPSYLSIYQGASAKFCEHCIYLIFVFPSHFKENILHWIMQYAP